MNYENFIHNDPDGYHDKEITLHDCIADRVYLEDGTLQFYLPDGFWVTPHHKANGYEKTIRTGASLVAFTIKEVDDISVRVFTRNALCWSKKSCVENWHIEQLIAAINNKKCTLEFITLYRSHYEQMWHCVIHSKKKPYYRECQLYLPETVATFFWNDLCPVREW